MGELVSGVLSEEDAREVCSWRYAKPYDVYNFSEWDTVVMKGWGLGVREKREAEFLALRIDRKLVGYGRIHRPEGRVVIGIGLRPARCGKGLGKEAMRLLMDEACRRHPGASIFSVEVRSFNRRAIRCYRSVGFVEVDSQLKDTPNGRDEFVCMEYDARQADRNREPLVRADGT